MNATLDKERKPKLLAGRDAWLMIGEKQSSREFCEPTLSFIEEIHHRAETMTPLLKGILEFRPKPNWRH